MHNKIVTADFIKIGLALLWACITFNTIIPIPNLDIDKHWMFAINHLYLTNELGVTTFFDFGPLGFLLWPMPLGNNVLIASLIWLALRFILALTIIELVAAQGRFSSAGQTMFVVYWGTIFFAAIPAVYNYFIIFFTVVSLLLLFNNDYSKKSYLVFAAIFATILFLLHPGYALASYAAIFSYLIVYGWKNKSIKLLVGQVFALIGCYFGLWLLLMHTLTGSIQYIITNYWWITQFDSSISLTSPNNWFYIGISLLSFGMYFVVFYKKDFLAANGLIVPFIFVLPLFLAFKYAFSREDIHLYFLSYFLVLTPLYFLMLTVELKKVISILLISVVALGFCVANQIGAGFFQQPLQFSLNGMTIINKQLIHYRQFKSLLDKLTTRELLEAKLDPSMLRLIGSNTVDIYPDNLILILANNLHWRQRPCVEAMVTLSEHLDVLNAQHFGDKDKAPHFIVWTPEVLSAGLFAFDRKFLLSGEPETIYQILKWYKPIAFRESSMLLERQVVPQYKTPIKLGTSVVTWDTWIKVPQLSNGILRAHIFMQETFLGKVKIFLYKQGNVWLDYKLTDGSIKSCRLTVATAKNGAWISPYIEKITELAYSKPNVAAIRMRHTADDFFDSKIVVNWDLVLPQ